MTKPRCQTNSRLIVLIIIAGLLAGCASVFQNFDDRMNRKRFKSDYEALDKALTSYEAGEFDQALTEFNTLAMESASATIARRARLGAICCHLMSAETATAYTKAIGMWHEFGDSVADPDSSWNLTLLDPLIVSRIPQPLPEPPIPALVLVQPPTAKVAEPIETKPVASEQDARRLQAELAAMKQKAQRADQLQQQLDRIIAENQSLKEKIKALEAIDQTIQKKKTEISAPSE